MKKRVRRKTFLVAAVSDIHFPVHNEACWESFVSWHRNEGVYATVFVGDVWDLPSISSYPQEADQPVYVAPAIREGVKQMHRLGGIGWILDGNHEARWRKALIGDRGPQFRGCLGLSFAEQTYAQGLDKKRFRWVFESKTRHGLYVGRGDAKTLYRHGDHQFRGGGPKYPAARMLVRTPHVNHVFGHCHKLQVDTYTSLGRTRWSVANPTMQPPQEFCKDPNWQLGFTALEYWGGKTLNACNRVNPYPVLMGRDGSFGWRGRVYG